MNGRDLGKALRGGQRVYGTCLVSTSPVWPAAMASIGYDMAFIESEHTPMDRGQLAWICRAYSARNMAPVVRIPEPDPYLACMALDGGAQGVIAPYVETREQVRELRGAVKLRPLKGERLRKALDGEEDLGKDLSAYLAGFNRHNVLIVNIESVPALEALDDILAEPGLDAVLVGPHDLSVNLGVPEQYGHPEFLAAVSTIIKKARAAGVGVGIHFFESIEQEIEWAKEGANLVMHTSDIAIARKSLAADLKRFKEALGEDAGTGDTGSTEVV